MSKKRVLEIRVLWGDKPVLFRTILVEGPVAEETARSYGEKQGTRVAEIVTEVLQGKA